MDLSTSLSRSSTEDLHKHVVLGRSNLQVSRLTIGAGYGAPASSCERAFHEHNVNSFYWSLPRRSGMKSAIRTLAPNHRDEMVIMIQSYSRVGMALETFFHRQLKALRIDRCDILLLGWFNDVPMRGVLATAERLREQGKVRSIAMSGHRLDTFGELAKRDYSPIDIFMLRYNAARRRAESAVFPHLPEEECPGVIGYTTTCWGHLLNAKRAPEGDGPLTARDCYRFSLSNPNIDTCLIGPRTDEEMREALSTLDSAPMTSEELDRARRIGDYVNG